MIRMTGKLAAVAILAATAGVFSLVWADVASPRPRWTTVRMESETVNITLGEKRVQVEAVFRMYNDGNDASVRMGYPLGLFEDALNEFAVTVDDQQVKDVGTEDGAGAAGPSGPVGGGSLKGGRGGSAESYRFEGPYKQWKVWNVPMKSNQERVVKVTYWVKPAQLKDAEKGDLLYYAYTLRTGATWKGKINEAVVTLTLDGVKSDRIVRRSPTGFELAENGKLTTWKMRDFKPTDDIEIVYRAATGTQIARTDGR